MSAALPLLVVSLLSPASGYSSAHSFDDDATHGGGAGYAFTGSPTAHGMTCATCHQHGEGDIALDFASRPAGLFTDGYTPGAVYDIDIFLIGETRGADKNGACAPGFAGCNRNAFAAELLSPLGVPAGLICPDGDPMGEAGCEGASGPSTTLLDGGAVVGRSLDAPRPCGAAGNPIPGALPCVDTDALRAAGYSQEEVDAYIATLVRGASRWTFRWRAPLLGDDDVTLHVAAVDGDGGTRLDPRFADYQGDGVAVHRLTLRSSHARAVADGSGCTTGTGLGVGLFGIVLVALTRRRAVSVMLMLMAMAPPADAQDPTSCDIITGASCAWGEGCDCDHDGYVRSTGEARSYCRFRRCPLDGNDRDANVLGVVSEYNADGDGFTTQYDCDDNDACIDGACSSVCGPVEPVEPTPDTSPSEDAVETTDAVDTTPEDTGPDLSYWIDLANDPARPSSDPVNGGAVQREDPPSPGCAGAGPIGILPLVLGAGALLLRRLRSLIVIALLALTAGCATTQPWERGTLAKRPMIFGAEALETLLEQHLMQYREGAAGGFGGGGGGCGCN